MKTYRGSLYLRQSVIGVLFAYGLSHARPAVGYTMVVWGDPYDSWGCVGACGGWDSGGYYDPYYSGDQSGGGGGSDPSASDLPTVPEVWCSSDDSVKRAGACKAIMQRNPQAEPGDTYLVQFEDGTQLFEIISRLTTICVLEDGPCVRD